MPADPLNPTAEGSPEGAPVDYDELEVSEWGLDWGDVSQIRSNLRLTPTERLRTAQELLNTALRIRARNASDRD